MTFSRLIGALTLVFAFQLSVSSIGAAPSIGAPDEVLKWNTIAISATQTATPPTPATPAFVQPRALAIVHASIFDALNGIEREYEPIHVR